MIRWPSSGRQGATKKRRPAILREQTSAMRKPSGMSLSESLGSVFWYFCPDGPESPQAWIIHSRIEEQDDYTFECLNDKCCGVDNITENSCDLQRKQTL